MKPRLKQPLFSVLEQAKMKSQLASTMSAANIVRLYDVLWNELYRPSDMQDSDINDNSHAMLDVLGHWLENQMGESAFEAQVQAEPEEYVQLDLFDFIKNSGTKPE